MSRGDVGRIIEMLRIDAARVRRRRFETSWL
jgi:hypothetical protein